MYLVKVWVISFSDPSSVCLSTHMHFDHRFDVISRQLTSLNHPHTYLWQKTKNILKWLIKQMQSTFILEETFVKMTRGGCCTWKSWGLLAKLWRFLVLDWSFWPGSPGDVTVPGTPASVTSPSSPPADQCTSTKKKKYIMQHVMGQSDLCSMSNMQFIFKAKAFHKMIFTDSCIRHITIKYLKNVFL